MTRSMVSASIATRDSFAKAANYPGPLLRFSIPHDFSKASEQIKAYAVDSRRHIARRFAVHLSTDKPVYRPSETLHWRGVVVDAVSLLPIKADSEPNTVCSAVIQTPQRTVFFPQFSGTLGLSQLLASIVTLGGDWAIPSDVVGGEYFLEVCVDNVVVATRTFQIRAFRNPQITVIVDFLSRGYTAGEEVSARISAKKADGDVPRGAVVQPYVTIDGSPLSLPPTIPIRLDNIGQALVTFKLPAVIVRGQGSLTVTVEDEAVLESQTKTIPIILQTIDIKFFPEGGNIIALLPNTVYFEALSVEGEPLHFEGQLFSADGLSVQTLHTEHEGRGSVTFTPSQFGEKKYFVRVSKPTGLEEKQIWLPEIIQYGAIVHAAESVFDASNPQLRFHLHLRQNHELCSSAPSDSSFCPDVYDEDSCIAPRGLSPDQQLFANGLIGGRYQVQVSRKNVLLARHQIIALDETHSEECVFTLSQSDVGVLLVTVSVLSAVQLGANGEKETWIPLSERLVLRRPVGHIDIQIETLSMSEPSDPTRLEKPKSVFVPGDSVKVRIKTTDQHGSPVKAILGLAVTDETALQQVEARKQVPCLPSQLMLEQEVHSLFDDYLFSAALLPKPVGFKAAHVHSVDPARGVDFLLGTQGWRRFEYRYLKVHQRRNMKHVTFSSSHRSHSSPLSHRFAMKTGDLEQLRSKAILTVQSEPQQAGVGVEAVPPASSNTLLNTISDASRASKPLTATFEESYASLRDRVALFRADLEKLRHKKVNKVLRKVQSPLRMVGVEAVPPASSDTLEKIIADEARASRPRSSAHWRPLSGVRVYRHQSRSRQEESGSDHTETLYFSAAIETTESGELEFNFTLSDSTTRFRIRADALLSPPSRQTNMEKTMEKSKPSGDLAYGARDLFFESRAPFVGDAKVPFGMTVGDRVIVPIAISNNAAFDISAHTKTEFSSTGSCSLSPSGTSSPALTLLYPDSALSPIVVAAGQSGRQYFEAEATVASETSTEGISEEKQTTCSGLAKITITLGGAKKNLGSEDSSLPSAFAHTITRSVSVAPRGFPLEWSKAGQCVVNTECAMNFDLPQAYAMDMRQLTHSLYASGVPHAAPLGLFVASLTASVKLYPNPAATLNQALVALVKEPHGCFEQISATTYPLVMALQYFESHPGVPDSTVARARDNLQRGYQRLLGFEAKAGGFGWFGSTGDEGLSAYAIMQFSEMSKVRDVDPQLLERTRAWLRSRENTDPSRETILYNYNHPRSRFGHVLPEITDAYILWCLTSSSGSPAGDRFVTQAQVLLRRAQRLESPFSQDAYYLGLVGGTLLNLGLEFEAAPLLKRIASFQEPTGRVSRSSTSITGSSGQSLHIETTALAVLSWIGQPEYSPHCASAVKWLAEQCRDGMFGSTQGTVLALRAIIAFDARAPKLSPLSAHLFLNDKQISTAVLDPRSADSVTFSDVSEALRTIHSETKVAGAADMTAYKLSLELRSDDTDKESTVSLPYSVMIHSITLVPPPRPSHPACPLDLTTSLSKVSLVEGEGVQLCVGVSTSSDSDWSNGLPMIVAVIGLPGGLEPRAAQLQELVVAKKIDFYELTSHSIVLYWQGMEGGSTRKLCIDATATFPGSYLGAVSSASLFFPNEFKVFAQPLGVDIHPSK